MLSKTQLDLIHIQLLVLDDVVRSIIYLRAMRAKQPISDRHKFLSNGLLELAVIKWCLIFGTASEDTHWKNLQDLPSPTGPYGRSDILRETGFTQTEWEQYWARMTDLRNQFFAHFDLSSMEAHIPTLDAALCTAISYRRWLISVLNHAISNGVPIIIAAPDTDEFLAQVERESAVA